jgi:hypothetical protein
MITRFNFSLPSRLQGVEDLSTPEMQQCIMEVIRRVDGGMNSFIDAVTNQIPADTDLLPALNNGASESSTESIATDKELEDAKTFNMIWDA